MAFIVYFCLLFSTTMKQWTGSTYAVSSSVFRGGVHVLAPCSSTTLYCLSKTLHSTVSTYLSARDTCLVGAGESCLSIPGSISSVSGNSTARVHMRTTVATIRANCIVAARYRLCCMVCCKLLCLRLCMLNMSPVTPKSAPHALRSEGCRCWEPSRRDDEGITLHYKTSNQ